MRNYLVQVMIISGLFFGCPGPLHINSHNTCGYFTIKKYSRGL